MKPNKYRAIRTVVDGITFASKKEAKRYGENKYRLKAGFIKNLKLQPTFVIMVEGVKICTYVADFMYDERTAGDCDGPSWKTVVEDAKGVLTPVYRLKKKLVKALYGIDIQEV